MVMFSLLLVAGLVATSLSATPLDVLDDPLLDCPVGWVLIERTCFLLTDEAGTWHEGQAYCNQMGASLATISSPTQQNAITGILSHTVWIGLNDLNEEHSYAWDDGSEINYTSWGDDEPDNDGGRCTVMRHKWNDYRCDSTFKFLCSMPQGPVITPHITTAPVCEQGWEMFENAMCYKVRDEEATWYGAREACLAQHAELAAVTSEGQQNFLAARLNGNTWNGLNDRVQEGIFQWQDGTKPGYTNWYIGEPNSLLHSQNQDVGEDCVEMVAQHGYKWNDIWCNRMKRYVCQKSPSQTRVLRSHT